MRIAKRPHTVKDIHGTKIGLAVTTAVLGMGLVFAPRSALAIAWNGTDPGSSATSVNGLTDNYGQFTNESVVTNTQQGEFGTGTYLGNGWMLTALHVVSGSTYGVTVPGTSMQINIYGQIYNVDQYVGWGSSDIQLIHLGGYTSGNATTLTGVERSQIYTGGSETGTLMQLGGFGVNDQLNAGTYTNNETFHRGFNLGVGSGGVVTTYANGTARLVQDGYLLGYQQGGDSGSGLWMDNGPDQDLDLHDWSLIGECINGTTPGYFGNNGTYGRMSTYQALLISTVFPHAWLTWSSNASSGTAVDGPGTWNLSSTNFTDGTDYAFNGPERTQIATFGAANGAAGTVTLGANIPIDSLTFNAAGSGNYTIAGGGFALTLTQGSTITTNVNATISAPINGGSSTQHGAVNEVVKNGTGTLTLTGATSLASGVTFHARAGTTIIGNGGSFSAPFYTSIAVYTGDVASLTVQGTGSFTTGGDFNLGDLGGSGTLTVQDTASFSAVTMYIGKGIGGLTGAGGTGLVNQTGGTGTAPTLSLATLHPQSVGTYNLSGGTLSTSSITGGLGTATFNFNGGQLTASGASTTFMQNLSSATINAAAVINTSGYNLTLAQPLLHSSAAPATDGGLTKSGSGTLTLGGGSTYTGPTLIKGGTLSLNPSAGAAAVAIQPVASYSFDNVSGSTVINGGTGGTAMNGTLTGSATIVPGGKFGNAVSLSSGGSVVVNNAITDTGGAADWTISAWVHTTTPGATILDKGDGSTWTWDNSIFYLGDGNAGGTGGTPSAVRYGRGFFQAAPGTPSVDDGTWHMVTYVDAAGSYAIYTDGNLVSLSSGNAGFQQAIEAGGVVSFGITTDSFAGDGTVNFTGLLDEIQIYNRPLTATQIHGLFTSDSPNPAATGSVLPAATPVTVSHTATLDLAGNNQTIGNLTGPLASFVSLGTGTLTLNTTGSATFSGLISGTGSVAEIGSGTQILGGDDTYTGTTSVTTGTLNLGANLATTGVIVRNSAGITITSGRLIAGSAASHANRDLIAINGTGLSISGVTNAWTGTLDLGTNDLDIANAGAAGLATITNQIRSGSANGAWNGPGIDSSASAGNSAHLTALGVILNNNTYGTAAGSLGTFDTINPGTNDVLVKYTYYGDANLDGQVDGSDYTKVDNGFSNHLTGWGNGDFNYDNAVDGSDYTLIDNAFNTQGGNLNSTALIASSTAQIDSASVPEPSVIALVVIGATAILRRRKQGTP